jgi:hypothetical protein
VQWTSHFPFISYPSRLQVHWMRSEVMFCTAWPPMRRGITVSLRFSTSYALSQISHLFIYLSPLETLWMLTTDCQNKSPFPPDATDFGSNPTEFTANTSSKRNKAIFVPEWKTEVKKGGGGVKTKAGMKWLRDTFNKSAVINTDMNHNNKLNLFCITLF